ncbi:hypothetical protein Btru_073729 [Bulinus truncatus]|nr:hypothetical protein Btru_073729 [Bulinus truncatus]
MYIFKSHSGDNNQSSAVSNCLFGKRPSELIEKMAKLFLSGLCFLLFAVSLQEVSSATTCVCTITASTCSAYSTYITCLQAVTQANNCTTIEVSAASTAISAAKTAFSTLGCSV